jgi:hypothetical protein
MWEHVKLCTKKIQPPSEKMDYTVSFEWQIVNPYMIHKVLQCPVQLLSPVKKGGYPSDPGISQDHLNKTRYDNTILVKLKLWELVIVFNKTFWSATNLRLRYASAKCDR